MGTEKKEANLPDIIKSRKILPLEVKKNIIYNIFFNCLLFIIMIIITLIVNLSFNKLSMKDFDSYIDIIQIFCCIISVSVLEVAYRKGSGRIGMYGIEMLVFSICILFVPYMYISKLNNEFLKNSLTGFFIYYFLKSLGIYIYIRYSYLNENMSDVKEIVKEEKKGYIDEESTKTLKLQKMKQEKSKIEMEEKLKKEEELKKSEEMKKIKKPKKKLKKG